MINIAIKGHPTRGNEVIKTLEILGGKNIYNLNGISSFAYYTIEGYDNAIKGGIYIFGDEPYTFFSIEDFKEKFPYKIGDRVMIPEYESELRINDMKWDGYTIVYRVDPADETEWFTSDELKEFNEEICTESKEYLEYVNKPTYPKTYEECCKIIGYFLTGDTIIGHKTPLLRKFQKLLVCRDAYWKIAGEELGLDKPWEQDYNDTCFIIANNYGYIHTYEYHGTNNFILAFPTEEMQNTFYENFKDIIEECKEIL